MYKFTGCILFFLFPMFIFFPFYLFIFPSPAKMDLGEDLGPDKKYLNRSIQTEDDSIFEYAEDIVNNFNRIKRNLDQLRFERYLYLTTGFIVGVFWAKYGF